MTEEVKTYSIISVRGTNKDGTIEGFWTQDCIGTLTESKKRAAKYTEREKNKKHVRK